LLSIAAVPNALPDQQDEAGFRLAELDYYAGRFSAAVARLEGISSNTQANFANDALSLLALLRENTSTEEQALRELARADFLACQHRYSEALPVLRSVIDRFPQALLVDDALMRLATLQRTMRMYSDAIGSYRRLLTEFKESSIALDKAQFNTGDIYQYGLNDKIKAIDAYEKLLADYPQSILVGQARKRIRELRGDSL
jgi:tetratricopeptide (TPR) repeat protein